MAAARVTFLAGFLSGAFATLALLYVHGKRREQQRAEEMAELIMTAVRADVNKPKPTPTPVAVHAPVVPVPEQFSYSASEGYTFPDGHRES